MRDYRLGRCGGLTIEGAPGRLGYLEVLRRQPDAAAAALVLRGGPLGRRAVVISAGTVEAVRRHALRVRLRAAA